ncbi:platelet-derived growth factor subunit B [Culicoides brevitarsis]|uniref:platelet-derived growth factor subunit B n=1 Tax=Culicoides brevitarsis TaxID=469753 RepID=UPI00307CC484
MEKIAIIICLLLTIVASSHIRKRATEGDSCPECDDNSLEIPISFGKELNKYELYSDYVHSMLDEDTIDQRDDIYLLVNGTSSEVSYQQRSVAIRPKPAACIPDTTVVSLRPKEERDPTIVYFPSCTRVKRCGGCCSHQLLSCQPTEIQTITYEVIKSQYTGGTKMTYRGKDLMPVEEHLKCKCDCRIKEEDCNKAFQKYDKSQCKCYCTNVDDQHKCLQDRATKIWDSSSCVCRCRDIKQCSTNYHFDHNSCDCVSNPPELIHETTKPAEIPTRSLEERRRLIVRPTIINPDDSTVYTT